MNKCWQSPTVGSVLPPYHLKTFLFVIWIVMGRERADTIFYLYLVYICMCNFKQELFFFFLVFNVKLLSIRIWDSSIYKVFPGCQQSQAPSLPPLSQHQFHIGLQPVIVLSLILISSILHLWLVGGWSPMGFFSWFQAQPWHTIGA